MRARLRLWACCFGLALGVAPAYGLDDEAARQAAIQEIGEIETRLREFRARGAPAADVAETERIATAEMLLRARDYEAAVLELGKLVELCRQGRCSESAHADALFLLGGAYFQSNELLSARRYFSEVLKHAGRAAFAPHAGRSLSRLVDIAAKTHDRESLESVLAVLDATPGLAARSAGASLLYARAKALFTLGKHAPAAVLARKVPAGTVDHARAAYLLGVIAAKEEALRPPSDPGAAPKELPFRRAIARFRRVAALPAKTRSARHIRDLAWMATARLYYEGKQFADALRAYGRVRRGSPEFSRMLYELAWVHVELEDYKSAARTLEVLAATDPNRARVARRELVRADLFLRSDELERALKLYRRVRERYDPIREEVARFLASTSNPADYYDALTVDPVTSETGGGRLSSTAQSFVRAQARDARVFRMVDDIGRSRRLLGESGRLIRRLEAAFAGGTSIQAFPVLRAELEATTGLLNRIARARHALAEGLDDVGGSADPVQRRGLSARIQRLPVLHRDFEARSERAEGAWNAVSQELQRLTLEANRLSAVINGLESVVSDPRGSGVEALPELRAQAHAEVMRGLSELAEHERQIAELSDLADMGRVQTGFGDKSYAEDARARARLRVLLEAELGQAAAGQDGDAARAYALEVHPLWARLTELEREVGALHARYEKQGADETARALAAVRDERDLLGVSANELAESDAEARSLVGSLAMEHVVGARDNLRKIVLRADVGVTQYAWQLREAAQKKLGKLRRERQEEEERILEEMRDVLDEGAPAP